MLTRREWIVYLLVFMTSYILFLAYLQYSRPLANPVTYAARLQQAVRSVESRIVSPVAQPPYQNGLKKDLLANAALITNRQSGTQYGGALPSAVLPDPVASTLAPDYSSARAYFNSLDQAVRADDAPGNRIAAIQALRQLAANGDPDGSILEALRVATQDGDPAVVGPAQSAYSEAQALKPAH
jgi:hypothetical protein